jgi:hypothetical protein
MTAKTRKPRPLTFATVQKLALALPCVEEGTSYGTPGLRAAGKFLARLREDGETLVVRIDFDTRDALMQADPKTFFITDHYQGYPAVLVRLARVKRSVLKELLEEAWRFVAPKRLVATTTARGRSQGAMGKTVERVSASRPSLKVTRSS